MAETPSSPNPSAQIASSEQSPAALGQELAVEHRQAYGTAKTENLRDSGLWRILLPGFVLLCCLAVLAIPVIILVLLFYNSPSFVWAWVTMLVIELAIAAVIIRGLWKIFIPWPS